MKFISIRNLLLLVTVALFLPIVFSCGGGGGDSGGGGGNTNTPATIDSACAEQAAAMAMSAGDLQDIGLGVGGVLSSNPGRPAPQNNPALHNLGLTLLDLTKDKILSQTRLKAPQGSATDSHLCDTSGSVSMTATWDGPDIPANECDVSNVKSTITFSGCDEYGTYMNGTANLTLSGNFCAPTAISIRFANMTMDEGAYSVTISDLSINYTNITWSSGDDIVAATVTFNGDIATSSGGESFDMAFSNYTMTMAETGPTTTEISISGSLTGSCLDGWVTFETTSPIVIVDGVDCPTGGTIRMIGDGEAVTVFNPDGSMDIEINGGTPTHYASCNDLPDECL